MARRHVLLDGPRILSDHQCVRLEDPGTHKHGGRRSARRWVRHNRGHPWSYDEEQEYFRVCLCRLLKYQWLEIERHLLARGIAFDSIPLFRVSNVNILCRQYADSHSYDAAAHMSEELPRPSKYVPIAMLGSIVVNGLLGFVFCIIFLYCLGDLDALLQTATGFPFVQLYYNVTQNHTAATIMTLFHALVALAANSAGLTSTSRTAWAFARDRAFPFSGYYNHLGHGSQLPVRMCILLTVLQFLLGLIYIGNTTAFNAILSMSILGMYASYVLPIGFMLWYGRRASSSHAQGWFTLGKWGMEPSVLLWALAC